MKKWLIGSLSFLLLSTRLFAQTDPVQPQYITNGSESLDLSLVGFTLVEDKTFSYRESAPGVKTDTYFDMTSWDSSPYKQGYLLRNWGSFGTVMNYRLHFPLSYNSSFGGGYPLIVMMHGAGERANCWNGSCYQYTSSWHPLGNSPAAVTDNTGNKAQLLNNDHNLSIGGDPHRQAVNRAAGKLPNDPTLLANAWPGFVLFPQTMNGWDNSSPQDAIRIIRLLIAKYNIDPNRIFVHGLSNGGIGVYEIIKRAPWLFAGALPMSAINEAGVITTNNSVSPTWVDRIASIPIWQFQGGIDPAPKKGVTEFNLNFFRNYGMDIRYKLYPSLGHGVWNNAYAEPDFFLWMRNKNKANIIVRFGNTSICSTSGAGVEMRVSYGFWAYEWQRDGETIPGATTAIYTANIPGTYRVRFSRVQNPTEATWNRWSDPVVVKESNDPAPVITADGSTHIASGTVKLNAPAGNKYYQWFKDGVKMQFPNGVGGFYKDTLAYINAGVNGDYTVKTAGISSCYTPLSQPAYVRVNAPLTIAAPDNVNGIVTSPSSVNLFWRDNANTETAFEVYRAPDGSSTFALIAVTGEDAISYLDQGLSPNTTYQYKLRAISNTAESPYSSVFSINTVVDGTPPTAPQNLAFVSTSITNATTAAITVDWDPATDDSGIKNYTVSYAYGANPAQTITVPASQTTLQIPGLVRDQRYRITVVANDLIDNVSPASNQLYAETNTTGLNYFMSEGNWATLYGFPSNTTTAVNWSKIEDTGTTPIVSLDPRKQDDFFYIRFEGYIYAPGVYKFTLRNKEGGALYIGGINATTSALYPNPVTSPGAATASRTLVNDGIKDGGVATEVTSGNITLGNGAYPLSIIFFESTGGGEELVLYWEKMNAPTFARTPVPASAFRSGPILTPVIPAAPTNVVATAAGQSSINLTWDFVGASSFEIYRSLTTDGTYASVGQTTNTNFTSTGLNPGITYFYKVKTIDANGSSEFSNVASAATTGDTNAPTVPTNLQVLSQTFTSVGLAWTASTDDVAVASYNIYADDILIANSLTNTFIANDLTANTAYSFTVAAVDASGNESAKSSPQAVVTNIADIYYYVGSGLLTDVNSWGKNTDGTGVKPANFVTNGQYFVVTNTPAASLSNTWTLGGNVTKVIVASGTTLNVSQAVSGKISAEAGSTVNVNHASTPVFETLDPTSTVNFNNYTAIPQATYGNVNLTGSGIKTLSAGETVIAGNLTLSNDLTLKGVPGNGSTIALAGNLTINGAATEPAADNNVNLRLTGAGASIVSSGANLGLFKLDVAAGKEVTFSNTSLNPIDLRLGSANGGGLVLNNGASFHIGNNNLVFRFSSTINNGGQTGQVGIVGGDIDFTSNAAGSSVISFLPSENTVDYLNVNATGGGTLVVGTPALITDGIKIKQGILNSNSNITLESSATTNASIRTIENNGSITGAVTVKRYSPVQGVVFRYASIPVANVKVADFQQYINVTGNFTGANAGVVSPSMFQYNEPQGGWRPFPADGGSNQEIFERGRGYSFYNWNGASAYTWQVTGVPYQGDVTFGNLAPGTGSPGDGWSSVGNPYASPIIWGNTGWTTSGISNSIYIRSNFEGGYEWKVWNRAAATGNLTNGKIPAGQAFWIQATNASPSVKISETAKSNDPGPSNGNSYREGDMTYQGSIALTLGDSLKKKSDQTYVLINAESTDPFDKYMDSEKRDNTFFNLSSLSSDSVRLAVNQMADFCQKTVALSIDNITPGKYYIKVDDTNWNGSLLLIDRFTGTSKKFVKGSTYDFAVTSDTLSFGKRRFALELIHSDIDIDVPQLVTASPLLCKGSSGIVTVESPQQGASYTLFNQAGTKLGESIGVGSSIDFVVNDTILTEGVNKLSLVAEWNGCGAVQLPTTVSITHETLSVDAPEIIQVCQGEVVTITATGASATGSYRWFDGAANSTTPISTSAKLTTVPLKTSTAYFVETVGQYGCSSDRRMVTVNVIALDTPQVSQSGNTFYSSYKYNNQWMKDGQPITGATSDSFTPESPGYYSVQFAANGCAQLSDLIPYMITEAEQPFTSDAYFSVYPNPASQHELYVKGNLKPSAEVVEIDLVDVYGKSQVTNRFAISDINQGVKLETSAASLAQGVYIVVMKQGGTLTKRKVVIH